MISKHPVLKYLKYVANIIRTHKERARKTKQNENRWLKCFTCHNGEIIQTENKKGNRRLKSHYRINDLEHTHRAFHSTKREYSFFESIHRMFSWINIILEYKTILIQLKIF